MTVNSPPRIVGVGLMRNEAYFAEWAVLSVLDFCDEIVLLDNCSDDGTFEKLNRLAERFPKISVQRIANSNGSNRYLRQYANTHCWILGIDGDEVYDPVGLGRLRSRILAGEFASNFQVYGHVLHVQNIAMADGTATGYGTPPAKSLTKLYNAAAVAAWRDRSERLMGTPTFNAPFSHDTARRLYSEESWDESDFRCLHLCFYPRSPRDAANVPGRPNTAENSYKVAARRIKNVFRRLAGKPIDSGNKHRFYRKGPLVTHNVESFRLRREYMDLVQDWPTVQAVLAKAPEL